MASFRVSLVIMVVSSDLAGVGPAVAGLICAVYQTKEQMFDSPFMSRGLRSIPHV
jgi:hypothetical protein